KRRLQRRYLIDPSPYLFCGPPEPLREDRTHDRVVKTKPRRASADESGGLTVREIVACYPTLVTMFDRLTELPPERVRPLKRVEYERLVEAGFFEDEQIELLNGVIFEKHASDRTRPLKRVEYERLVSEGLFDDERIELLGGVMVEMSPQDTR